MLIDLDGVVTETATLHAEAWKTAFDRLLARLPTGDAGNDEPFDPVDDYLAHVDGKPREDGVRGFLAARGIGLPEGAVDDPPDADTVHGVANAKNAAYHHLLETEGARVHQDARDFIARARFMGLRCAVVSASRNTARVLESVGLAELFDLRVDGHDIAREGLRGKPAPDMFLLAARRAGVAPGRAVVVEDATAGVAAGRAGGFGRVIGVARRNTPEALLANGADVAVTDLGSIVFEPPQGPQPVATLNPADSALPEIEEQAEGKRVAAFFDYDGTLTPIVARPDLAILSDTMREALRRLAKVATVAVISGRDRQDVAERVGVDGLVYAGSHGFDIAGPAGKRMEHVEGAAHQEELGAVADELEQALGGVDGVIVERKAFGVAVHYRQVAPADQPKVDGAVAIAHERHPSLKRTTGKKVHEFRPGIAWDKGRAVLWLLDALELSPSVTLTLYLGDDVTDEDAFAALAETGRGLGILVGEGYGPTRAFYRLPDTDAVRGFLNDLAAWLEARTGA